MTKLLIAVCAFFGAVALARTCSISAGHSVGTLGGFSISWALVIGLVVFLVTLKMKAGR